MKHHLIHWSWSTFLALGSPSAVQLQLGHAGCTGKAQFSYQATISRTEAEREKGLGGRLKALDPHEGMLFVYSEPGPRTFWMKDTHIPLSIFYFDSQGKLLSTAEMPVEPDPVNPAKLYPERGAVSAVLEVAPGTGPQAQALSLDTLCIKK